MELVYIRHVAERLQVSDQTIRRWIKVGELLATKPVGGTYRIRPKDLDDFLERYMAPKGRAPQESGQLNKRLSEEERRLLLDLLGGWRTLTEELKERLEDHVSKLPLAEEFERGAEKSQELLTDFRAVHQGLRVGNVWKHAEPYLKEIHAGRAVPEDIGKEVTELREAFVEVMHLVRTTSTWLASRGVEAPLPSDDFEQLVVQLLEQGR